MRFKSLVLLLVHLAKVSHLQKEATRMRNYNIGMIHHSVESIKRLCKVGSSLLILKGFNRFCFACYFSKLPSNSCHSQENSVAANLENKKDFKPDWIRLFLNLECQFLFLEIIVIPRSPFSLLKSIHCADINPIYLNQIFF